MTAAEPIVYVVDDDDAVRRSLSRLLRSAGLRVEIFDSPLAFLAEETAPGPACLVLDVMMPELSGLELQDRLREVAATLPIVFVTGHGTIPMSVRALKRGAFDFLEKPIEAETLIVCVGEALAHHSKRLREDAIRRAVAARYAELTGRERDVFQRVVRGMLNKEIAADLGIAEKTVKVHRGNVMRKMAADSLAHLVRMAQQLDPDVVRPTDTPADR